MRKGAAFAHLLFIEVALVDDVTNIVLIVDILDERIVFLVVAVFVILDFLEVDLVTHDFRLVVGILGLFVLDEIGIGDRLVIERDLLDLFLGLFFLVRALAALGILGLVGVVTRLLGPYRTLIGIAQQRTR